MDINKLFLAMYNYYRGDPHQAQHLVKVHSYARQIGITEGLVPEVQHVLEAAAVVHDIGIKNARLKHGTGHGKLQEIEGPPEAATMLHGLGYTEEFIERVCFLVGHHHTYEGIDSPDWQILIEADFLVNMHEENLPEAEVRELLSTIFKTESGKRIAAEMFGL